MLDDLQTPADLNGLWPPATRTGRVLVTTRRRDAALADGRRRVLDLGVFTADETVAYLRHKLPREPVSQLHQLAAGLGHLPLALAQATAYLTDRGLDCAGYQARLTDRRRALAQLLPEPEALPTSTGRRSPRHGGCRSSPPTDPDALTTRRNLARWRDDG